MARKINKKTKPIPIALQYIKMKKDFNNWDIRLRNNILRCVGFIQPTPASISYKVMVKYKMSSEPIIKVLEPEIKTCPEEILPHVYEKDILCLYYPVTKEWNKSKYISQFIIPWISEWLYYFEVWKISKKWFGRAIKHKPK